VTAISQPYRILMLIIHHCFLYLI